MDKIVLECCWNLFGTNSGPIKKRNDINISCLHYRMDSISLFSSIRQESPIHRNDTWLITYGDIKSFLHNHPQSSHKHLLTSFISTESTTDEHCISYEEFLDKIDS